MKLGPEDVSLLERGHHFRGWYVQAPMEFRQIQNLVHKSTSPVV